MTAHALERIATIPELAAEAGVSARTMRRWLRKLHGEHGGKWLFRFGEREYAVNRSLLKASHPELFTRKNNSAGDVERLEHRLRELEKKQNALAHRFREASNAWFRRGTQTATGGHD